MTTTTHPAPTTRPPTDRLRRTAFIAGGLYVLTFAASIPALFLITPVLDDPAGYVTSSGADDWRVLWGSFLDVVTVLAGIGTAVALFSVVKRQNEGVALAFVTSRVLEAAIIIGGVVSLLSLVTLRQAGSAAGADAALTTTSQALAAMREWTQLFGPNLLAGVNGLLLGYLLYRSGLVPRIIPMLGLIGGPLLIVSTVAVLFGVHSLGSASFLLTVPPIFVWELSLGVWLVVKGFRPSPVTAGMVAGSRPAHRGVDA
jgi:Domain of unknown function (DUF4386)